MKKAAYIVVATAIVALFAGTALADSAFETHQVSKLMNARAIDPSGKTLGTIDDLVLGADQRVSYVVIAKADKSGFVAVPMDAADPRVNPSGDVVVGITKDKFDEAPVFASNDWPDLSSRNDSARGYRGNRVNGMNVINGISTANPYPNT